MKLSCYDLIKIGFSYIVEKCIPNMKEIRYKSYPWVW